MMLFDIVFTGRPEKNPTQCFKVQKKKKYTHTHTHTHTHRDTAHVIKSWNIKFWITFSFAFNSLNDYFQVIFSRKSIFCTKTLHSLQEESSGFHCSMTFLNLSKSLISFRLLGTKSHFLGPRFEILSVLWYTVFIRGLENWEFCLRF